MVPRRNVGRLLASIVANGDEHLRRTVAVSG
jgi:hypothetical protein